MPSPQLNKGIALDPFSDRPNAPAIVVNPAESNNETALGSLDTGHPPCITHSEAGGQVLTEVG